MEMEIRYLAKMLLLPPLLQFWLCVVAWRIRKQMVITSRLLGYLSFLSLVALSIPATATYLAISLEGDDVLLPAALTDIQADAIVILSASQNQTAREFGEPVSEQDQLERVRYGAFLHMKTGLPLLVSGGSVYGREERSLARTMQFDVESFGGEVRWLEEKSRTTEENARYSWEILVAEEKRTILLVTSAMHMNRAKWSFESKGFEVIAAPTSFIDREPLNGSSFIPNAGSLELSSRALHEWLGYLVYRYL